MNAPIPAGPCAGYEHDLVELHEGSLSPEHARVIRLHVAACPRCRAWLAEFAAVDARLADALPQPALSADFERRLDECLSREVTPAKRSELRSAADREYRWALQAIGRGTRRHLLLDALGSAALAVCLLVLARTLLGPPEAMVQLLEGPEGRGLFAGIAVLASVGALAWSARLGILPLPGRT